MNNSLVSVIIPCYNYGKFLPETIESIEKQTYSNWEIVIADDGSTEDTLKVLAAYQNHPKIRILYLENGGPSRARNKAIDAAKGKYILPLDADDLISSTYLEKAADLLDSKSKLGIVYCEADFFGSMTGKWDLPEYKFPNILLDNCIFVSSVFRREDWIRVKGFDETFEEWEDFDFWLKLISLGREVYRIPEILFHYRKGHVSRSVRTNLEFIPVFERLIKNHRELYSDNTIFFIRKILEQREELMEEINQLKIKIVAHDKTREEILRSKEFRIGYYLLHFFSLVVNKIKSLFTSSVKKGE
jgi:glycosyltransferase involved in cell wall biosynthesis